ncbi:hypothetical protein [Oscillibacter sp. 1-3]|uniref:hypothetical protein n=1 Tax=Oscillibacter sp. 1-3 TaxID=1235797 RepID=UPI00033EEA63|nr:hypothetical protein [Oscillibacter sp. 1-3]EOS67421.1 hypothetical protein C816_00454 [Oscillibacter sp. 1-3]
MEAFLPIFDKRNIEMFDRRCFSFELSLSEIGINSDLTLDIIMACDNERLPDGTSRLKADIFAKKEGVSLCGYIYTITISSNDEIPVEEQAERIYGVIDGDRMFCENLAGFVVRLDELKKAEYVDW